MKGLEQIWDLLDQLDMAISGGFKNFNAELDALERRLDMAQDLIHRLLPSAPKGEKELEELIERWESDDYPSYGGTDA